MAVVMNDVPIQNIHHVVRADMKATTGTYLVVGQLHNISLSSASLPVRSSLKPFQHQSRASDNDQGVASRHPLDRCLTGTLAVYIR